MKQRPRIYYTDSQKAVMWERWKDGESLEQIAQLFNRSHSSIEGILSRTGGIRPAERHRCALALICERYDWFDLTSCVLPRCVSYLSWPLDFSRFASSAASLEKSKSKINSGPAIGTSRDCAWRSRIGMANSA